MYTAEDRAQGDFRNRSISSLGRLTVVHWRVQPSGRVSKEAGLVLLRIFEHLSQDDTIEILCADGEVRTFKYRFYKDNGMFRLNIPNSTPLVTWAREHKLGIAHVEYGEAQGALCFEILPPGQSMMDIVERSLALGTWGRTPTRLYGWY